MIKSFVLRVDAETMEAIEKWAADEFRSTNGQLQWIIAEALRKSGRMKKKKTIIRKVKKCKIKEVDDKWQCACGDTTKIVSKKLLSRVYNPY